MRIVTRSDFDGVVCAILLKKLNLIDSWKFVHPKDLQDGLFIATEDDILANVPYVPGCGMWFDHHSSESERLGKNIEFKGESRKAKSAARVIYEHFGGAEKFPNCEEMMEAVDKTDSGDLTIDEILDPKGWILFSFLCDPRTGIGRNKEFTVSNFQLAEMVINNCNYTIEQILKLPDVIERVKYYRKQTELYKDMVRKHTRVVDNVIVTDLRNVTEIYSANRFVIYCLYPAQDISLWIVDGKGKQNVSIACGYSILTRTNTADVGALMLKYGGGGHHMVGTCQVESENADKAIEEIIEAIRTKK